MKKIMAYVLALVIVGAASAVWACDSCDAHKKGHKHKHGHKHAKADAAVLCGECGPLKGGDVCCAKDAKICAKCGFAKEAPACCKLRKGEGKDIKLCPKCKGIAGSKACCAKKDE
ncbi:MAG: hypothetical protein ACI9OU_000561 [Candidatus Promineifilaceae bacterium]|jgi:hypothetical protein